MWRQYAKAMNDTLFVYRKDREVKVLDYLEACDRNDDLIDDGWSDHAVGAQATLKLLGSLQYMAPEVGDAPPWLHGPWSDLYSAGLVLWELLTGSLPHGELQGVALLMRRASEPAPVLPLRDEPDLLSLLEASGRLVADEEAANAEVSTVEEEELSALMGEKEEYTQAEEQPEEEWED